MPKLPARTGKEILNILPSHGSVLDHVTGSHHILISEDRMRRIVVNMWARHTL